MIGRFENFAVTRVKNVKYSHTRLRALGTELIPVSWQSTGK